MFTVIFTLALSSAIPLNSASAEDRIVDALEDNFYHSENTYIFDRETAIQDGLTSEEADNRRALLK